jgi:hypothetical protein
MSKDRIQIDGIWYIREDKESEFDISDQVFHVRQCGYEDDDVVLECNYSVKDNPEPHDTPCVTFLDKARYDLDWTKREFWDNTAWMRDVVEGYPESIDQIPAQHLPVVKAFFKYLIEKNILK